MLQEKNKFSTETATKYVRFLKDLQDQKKRKEKKRQTFCHATISQVQAY